MLDKQELDSANCRLAQALSSLSLGMWLQEKTARIRSDIPRPVIVAENMIGCAMYELVRACPILRSSLKGLTSR